MIVDVMANWKNYADLAPGIAGAFRFLEENAGREIPPGEHEIDGRRLFVLCMRSDSVPIPGSPFETHRRYADIHYLISGKEIIGWAPLAGLQPRSEYDPKGDVAFFEPPTQWSPVEMEPGYFAIFLPDDPHMPGRHRDEPCEIQKLVVKILVK